MRKFLRGLYAALSIFALAACGDSLTAPTVEPVTLPPFHYGFMTVEIGSGPWSQALTICAPPKVDPRVGAQSSSRAVALVKPEVVENLDTSCANDWKPWWIFIDFVPVQVGHAKVTVSLLDYPGQESVFTVRVVEPQICWDERAVNTGGRLPCRYAPELPQPQR